MNDARRAGRARSTDAIFEEIPDQEDNALSPRRQDSDRDGGGSPSDEFAQLPSYTWRDPMKAPSGNQYKIVSLIAYHDRGGAGGRHCYATQKTMAKTLGMKPGNFSRDLRAVMDRGWVRGGYVQCGDKRMRVELRLITEAEAQLLFEGTRYLVILGDFQNFGANDTLDEKGARALLSKWLDDYGNDAVRDALDESREKNTGGGIGWLKKKLPPK